MRDVLNDIGQPAPSKRDAADAAACDLEDATDATDTAPRSQYVDACALLV